MIYAGIGSRKTPRTIQSLMTKCANQLHNEGFTLRSGGAQGADTAFELGAQLRKEIYLPWRRFNGNDSHLFQIDQLAYAMARRYHPAWDRCSPAARKFHARNCYQMLGRDLATPADFVLCWTPNGAPVGGTGQALRIADDYQIPVINMAVDGWSVALRELVDNIRDEYAGAYEQERDAEAERYLTTHFNECGTPLG